MTPAANASIIILVSSSDVEPEVGINDEPSVRCWRKMMNLTKKNLPRGPISGGRIESEVRIHVHGPVSHHQSV